MFRKLPRKSLILSLILVAIGIVHILYGIFGSEFHWVWILLCFAGAVGNLLAEWYLTSRSNSDEESDTP